MASGGRATGKRGQARREKARREIIIMSGGLRGPTPFEDMIFYLWTDSNEICTAYVKLNSEHILFMRIFLFLI